MECCVIRQIFTVISENELCSIKGIEDSDIKFIFRWLYLQWANRDCSVVYFTNKLRKLSLVAVSHVSLLQTFYK